MLTFNKEDNMILNLYLTIISFVCMTKKSVWQKNENRYSNHPYHVWSDDGVILFVGPFSLFSHFCFRNCSRTVWTLENSKQLTFYCTSFIMLSSDIVYLRTVHHIEFARLHYRADCNETFLELYHIMPFFFAFW